MLFYCSTFSWIINERVKKHIVPLKWLDTQHKETRSRVCCYAKCCYAIDIILKVDWLMAYVIVSVDQAKILAVKVGTSIHLAGLPCQPICIVSLPACHVSPLCFCFCCLLYQSGFLDISLSNLLFLYIYVLCWMSLSQVSLYWLLWHQINLTAWASNIHL